MSVAREAGDVSVNVPDEINLCVLYPFASVMMPPVATGVGTGEHNMEDGLCVVP
jgi:hypothetical protein